MKHPSWERYRLVLAAAALLAVNTAHAVPNLNIAAYSFVSQRRVSVTVYEFTYKAIARNHGTLGVNVQATLAILATGTTIVDGQLSFGNVQGGGMRQSTDTFVIRQDRSKGPLRANALLWSFSYTDPNFGRMPGAPGALAADAAVNFFDDSVSFTAAELSGTGTGGSVLRTELLIAFEVTATVAQVNAVLDAHGGRITAMLAGRTAYAVRLPDPGNLAALEAKVAAISAMPGVRHVRRSEYAPFALPPNPAFQSNPPARLDTIDHHLAIRINGAWNARRLFEQSAANGKLPIMVVVDHFGAGAPKNDPGFDPLNKNGFNLLIEPGDYSTAAIGGTDAHSHGYDVISAFGASFGGSDDTVDLATGVSPVTLKLKAFDLEQLPYWHGLVRMIDYVDSTRQVTGANIVVNTSLGNKFVNCAKPRAQCVIVQGQLICHPPVCDTPGPIDFVSNAFDGEAWLQLLRGRDITDPATSKEFQFLHFTAAGNNFNASAISASPFAYAGQPKVPLLDVIGQPILDPLGNPRTFDGLQNILAVEGRFALGGTNRPASTCNDIIPAFSPGGNLSAIGSVVDVSTSGERGIFLPLSTVAPIYKSGSSFASPQAAGVAALVWAANPALSMSQVKSILLQTKGGINTPTSLGSPGSDPCLNEGGNYHDPVDAYAAVLAADNPDGTRNLGTQASAHNAPVRLAILDVASADTNGNLVDTPDGKFTQADIYKFLQEFQQRRGSRMDYSRYDLNADGRSGEPVVVSTGRPRVSIDTANNMQRFDLNGNFNFFDGAFLNDPPNQTIEGVPLNLNEQRIEDISVLVYYAYSPLYEGSEYERTLLLLPYLEYSNKADRDKPFLRGLQFDLTGLTLTIAGPSQLSGILYPASAGTENLAGTQFVSDCGQERGTPLFSADVMQAAANIPSADDVASPTFWFARFTDNTPPAGQNSSPRCSDFIAALPGTGRMWVNITKFLPGSPNLEYQTRLYLGEPDLAAPPSLGFQPGPKRLLTQRGKFGFVDLNGPGSFSDTGPGSNNFRLLHVGFLGDAIYFYQVRGPGP